MKDDNTDFLTKFKSKRPPTIAGVDTVLTAMPVMRISDANDWVRLHPDEDDVLVARTVLRERSDQR